MAHRLPQPAHQRVLAKVLHEDRGHTSPCWCFHGAIDQCGYGQVHIARHGAKKIIRKTHRVVYEHLVGPIPGNLTLDHLCRIKNCCNPAHLEPVTRAENSHRAAPVRTHCIRGHAYTPDTPKRGTKRICRQCRSILQAEYVARRRSHLAALAQSRGRDHG